MQLSKAQQRALLDLYRRNPNGTYLAFRRNVRPIIGKPDVAMVQWCGMTLGIEPDGYVHS